MPSARIIVTIIAAVAALAAFYISRGTYPPPSKYPMGISMAAFIGVYVVGNLLWGVFQGMREARAEPQAPRPPRDPNPPR